LEQHINPEEDKNEIKEKEKGRMLMAWRKYTEEPVDPIKYNRILTYNSDMQFEDWKKNKRKTLKPRTTRIKKNPVYARSKKKSTLTK
jgi:hypothetical protein